MFMPIPKPRIDTKVEAKNPKQNFAVVEAMKRRAEGLAGK